MAEDRGMDSQQFEKLGEEVRREYAYAALGKWKDSEAALNRSALALVLLAIGFELINRGLITKVSFSGIDLNHARPMNIFLLIIFAYQCSVLAEFAAESDWSSTAYDISIRTVMHKGSDWWAGALTPGASVFTAVMRMDLPRQGATQQITYFFQLVRAVLFFVWPIVFISYGYVQLFMHYSPNWLIIASLLASTIQIVFAGFALVAAPEPPGGRAAALRPNDRD